MATNAVKGNGVATLTKATQNGKASTTKVVNEKGALETQKVVQEAPKEEVKQVVPLVVETPLKKVFSLAERIERVKLLDGLVNKRQKVVATLTDLRKFQFSADESCELELSDSSGKEFRTGNSNLIGMLSTHLESLLQDKVKELDEQIQDFDL